ncbi:MAG: SWIM zinc finger family protein, partial [Bacteroidota bacterium]
MSKRIENIKAGADELLRWLVDTVYLGTAERHALSPPDWQALSARMIDAQARGLANRILQLSQL